MKKVGIFLKEVILGFALQCGAFQGNTNEVVPGFYFYFNWYFILSGFLLLLF